MSFTAREAREATAKARLEIESQPFVKKIMEAASRGEDCCQIGDRRDVTERVWRYLSSQGYRLDQNRGWIVAYW